jgi:PAH dioxygenase large subunit
MTLVDPEGMRVSRRAYWDEDVHALELDRVFRKSWIFLGHESEIADPGDYVTRRMGKDHVIVSRDEHGVVHAFLNSCLHRGTQLCRTDSGNSSHFRCSYHGWTYTNSGQLRGVPEQNEMYQGKLDKAGMRLIEPRVQTYLGLVFATWDDAAESLFDYLGDVRWYLEAVLSSVDNGFEVYGPPSRGLVKMNWKIGAENYGGDGYHLSTTHKSPIDLGIFGTGRELLGMEDLGREPSHCVSIRNGHAVRVQQLPVKWPEPTFLGYPPELWPQFEKNLEPEQIDMKTGLAVIHGNVFPNLSFIDYVNLELGDVSNVSTVHLRQWHPIGPDQTELWMWSLVPRDATPQWKADSHRAFTRTLGFGGIFETDDFQNWTSMAHMNAGPVAQDHTYDYQGGMTLAPATDVNWPGDVYAVDHTEVGQHGMYKQWQSLMEREDS